MPFIALGIPGDIVTAALLGGLMIKGITPGPLFSSEHPDTVLTIYISVLVASILVFVIMTLIGIRYFPQCLRLPKYILLPIVMIFALIGTYNMNFTVNDVWCALVFGVMGFIMDKVGMPKTPMVITMILGSSFETRLRSALSLSNGSLMPFLTKPYALIFVVATIVTIGLPVVKAVLKKSKAKA